MSEIETANIYIILCSITLKVYVGSAKDTKVRFRNHKNELRKGSHNNGYLQAAWNKYGEDKFEFHIIDACLLDDRWNTEQWWIDELKACDADFGFNVMHSAEQLLPSPVMSKLLKDYWADRWSDSEYRFERTKQLQSIVNRPEVKAKMSSSKKANWSDPEYRKRQIAAQTAVASTEEKRKANSERLKKLWQDPEYRARQTAERAKRFKDPKFIEKLSKAASNRKSKWFTRS